MSKRVLIVDDDALLCNLLKMALRCAGYDTHEVYSGQDALDYLREQGVDLILLDVMMADLNGIDVMRVLQADEKLSAIPVMVLTARVDSASQKIGMDAGAVEYLTKPITPEALTERVQAVLGKPE